METIYDFRPTDEEIKKLRGEVETKEQYCEYMNQEGAWNDIVYLLWLRGNKVAAELYVSKLPPMRQVDFWRTVRHP